VEELVAFLREHVPATHIPTIWRFVDAIPRTGSVKVARAELKAFYANLEAQDSPFHAGA